MRKLQWLAAPYCVAATRLMLALFSALPICPAAPLETAPPPGVSPPGVNEPARESPPGSVKKGRVLFIVTRDCPQCDRELARLRRPGGDFDQLRRRGWKIGAAADNHLQIIDALAVADLVERLDVRTLPTVAFVEQKQIVRSFKSGCTTPLDVWTFGFLAKGIDERPAGSVSEAARVETTGHYPLRGNHWSIDEIWNPTREQVVKHLRGPNHGHQIRANYQIETWSVEELRSLHDNLHEREMGGATYSARSAPTSNSFSATRKASGR